MDDRHNERIFKELIDELKCLLASILSLFNAIIRNGVKVDCSNCPKPLCTANSVCASDDDGTATVTVPANSCVTKIYASFVREMGEAKYALIEGVSGTTTFFCHRFVEDSNFGGEFDTTLVQPLCVGPTGATFTVTAFAPNNTVQDNALVTITVVYCPNCCY